MKQMLFILNAIAWVIILGPNYSFADTGSKSSKEILGMADEARGNLEGVQWRVLIRSIEKGHRQQRTLNVKSRGYDFLAIMTAPPKVKSHKLLMVDHNMWFTKPGLKKPVPVSSRQKLIGGASYGDIAATNYADDYEAVSLADTSVNGEPCYLFDLKAVTKKATYDRIRYWISKPRVVGVQAEYYTVSGKLFKRARFEYENQIQLDGKPHLFISKMIILDALVAENVTNMDFTYPKLAPVSPSDLDLNLLNTR